MALEGFEPPTPRLRVWCSNQTELQNHNRIKDNSFKNLTPMFKELNLPKSF